MISVLVRVRTESSPLSGAPEQTAAVKYYNRLVPSDCSYVYMYDVSYYVK